MKMNCNSTERVFTRMENETSQWRLVLFRGVAIGLCVLGNAITTQKVNSAAEPPAPASFCSGRILVKPKEEVSLPEMASLHSRMGTRVLRTFPSIGNLQVLELPPQANMQGIISAYQRSGRAAYAEPDYTVNVLLEPNDFNYGNGDLWNLKNLGQYDGMPGADIHATEGWDIQNTASNVIVAVIDTGVRYTHEDLAPNMWVNPGETGLDELGRDKATNGVDDDGDGYIDDVHGINTLLNNGDPNDDYGHGSHVAGIIGAAGNNSVGVVGVCWRVQLMACEFIDSQGNG